MPACKPTGQHLFPFSCNCFMVYELVYHICTTFLDWTPLQCHFIMSYYCLPTCNIPERIFKNKYIFYMTSISSALSLAVLSDAWCMLSRKTPYHTWSLALYQKPVKVPADWFECSSYHIVHTLNLLHTCNGLMETYLDEIPTVLYVVSRLVYCSKNLIVWRKRGMTTEVCTSVFEKSIKYLYN